MELHEPKDIINAECNRTRLLRLRGSRLDNITLSDTLDKKKRKRDMMLNIINNYLSESKLNVSSKFKTQKCG